MRSAAGHPPSRVSSRLVCVCAGLALAALVPDRTHESAVGPVANTASRSTRASGSAAETPALPAGVASDWWTAVRAQIEQEAYAVRPAKDTTPGTFEADNPAQRWQTRFTSAGVAITPMAVPAGDLGGAGRAPQSADPGHVRHSADTGSPATGASFEHAGSGAAVPPAAEEWTVGLRLAAYGAGDVLTPVSAVAPRGEGARVEFRYGESREGAPALTEWYVNEARGLEHGFTLAEAPAGVGLVTLQLAVSGGLQPVLEPGGLAVELRAADGAVRVRYADLVVTDASGRTLPGALSVPSGEPARIHLVVDTRGASYPITIDPLATTPATTLTGEAADNYFGGSVATAGDVNGDGYADVVVGANAYGGYTGRAYVYLGGASGLATTAATTLTGETGAFSSFGGSVATAGDVNGDGYADLVVGARSAAGGNGRAYVYLGGATGLATTAATTLTGETTTSVFGDSVATAGDVNGDGYADVVVGARGDSVNTGRVYVYLGGASGLATTAATTLTGEAAWNFFGMPVATAGDVNGDGYADLVVGAYGYGGGSGRAYVYLGGASGLATTAATTLTGAASDQLGCSVATAGDVNGDGYADVVVGASYYSAGTGRAYVHLGGASGLATTAATTLTGATNGNYFGYSVATAGDVNGDGFADVVVGAYGYSTNTGRAYVYLGGAGGLATSATLLTGETTANSFGASVATAGDVNGDGYADVVVGASGYSTNTGRAYVYHGGASGLATTAATTTTGAATNNRFGASVATAGDVNGDGYADVVVGAQGYSTNTGRA